MFDVIIIGGGAAGLSAALTLGRFRRSVLICDGGQPRNAKSPAMHNFISRDGTAPHDLLRIAREQLSPYSSVQMQAQEVIDIVPTEGHFRVHFGDGSAQMARKVLLATGVKDTLPAIEGIEGLWGRSVYHCPYCHGWEARDKAIAILANGDGALHLSKLLHSLSADIVICTNGACEIGDADRDQLARNGITIVETRFARINAHGDRLEAIVFADGSVLPRDVLFVRTSTAQHSDLPAKLGCAMTEQGLVKVDEQGKTSIVGVYAAGDMASPMQQVIIAAAKGAAAAAFINAELAHENFAA